MVSHQGLSFNKNWVCCTKRSFLITWEPQQLEVSHMQIAHEHCFPFPHSSWLEMMNEFQEGCTTLSFKANIRITIVLWQVLGRRTSLAMGFIWLESFWNAQHCSPLYTWKREMQNILLLWCRYQWIKNDLELAYEYSMSLGQVTSPMPLSHPVSLSFARVENLFGVFHSLCFVSALKPKEETHFPMICILELEKGKEYTSF